MRCMNREAITQIFRSVPVWLWPFVWLQLVAEQAAPCPGARAFGHPGLSGVFPGSVRARSVHGWPAPGIDTS